MIRTQSFGSTNVAVLKSNALKQGSVLLEVWFKVDVVAPKSLNLPSSLPNNLFAYCCENGQDLSEKIDPTILKPYLHHLDGNSCRQVVKARREVKSVINKRLILLKKVYLSFNSKQKSIMVINGNMRLIV